MPDEVSAPVTADVAVPETTPSQPSSLRDRLEAAKEKAAKADAPVEVVAPVEPPKEKTGSALAKLAKEQKATREALDLLKAEKAALEKERLEVTAWRESKADFKRYPLKALEQLGLSIQDLNEAALAEGASTPNLEVKAVREEIAKIRQEQEERENRLANEQRKQIAAQEADVLRSFQAECSAFVDQHAETFELTAKLEQQHLVFQTIDEVYRQTAAQGKPRVLSIEEAAAEVERHLFEMADKAQQTKKFTARQSNTPPQKQTPPNKASSTKPPDPATKTLSNTGSAPSSSNGAQSSESWAQRRARVYAKLS